MSEGVSGKGKGKNAANAFGMESPKQGMFLSHGKNFYNAGWILYLDLKAASECIQNANTLAPVSASSGCVRLDQGRPMQML